MILTKCRYCDLPQTIHFAFCIESGIRGNMPADALRPGAIMEWKGEASLPKLSFAQKRAVALAKMRDHAKQLDATYRRPDARKP